jgi:hypothetical protein
MMEIETTRDGLGITEDVEKYCPVSVQSGPVGIGADQSLAHAHDMGVWR